MQKKVYEIESLDSINEVAKEFLKDLGQHSVIAFYGLMGVGKTTFIKAISEVLKVEDVVNSPSFAIVNEYMSPVKGKVFHFDFYRLKNIDEAYDLGFEDYFYSNNLCLIEWPEKVEAILPEDLLEVTVEEDNGKRIITAVAR